MTRFLHTHSVTVVPSKKNPLRSVEARSYRTLAYRVVREYVDEETGNLRTEIEYEHALCHHRDQFSRKIGRAIAEGRMLKHGGTFVSIPFAAPQSGEEWRVFESYLRDTF